MSQRFLSSPTWAAQDEELRRLWNGGDTPDRIAELLGRSIAAIMTRAARLGLPRRFSPGRKPQHLKPAGTVTKIVKPLQKTSANANKQVRPCLMCQSDFYSSGPHNRVCPRCKESPEYVSASRLAEHIVSI